MNRKRLVSLKVDESFFNQFDQARKKRAEELRIPTLSNIKFSAMIAKEGLLNARKINKKRKYL